MASTASQVRQVIGSKCEFAVVLSGAEAASLHFEPQLRDEWLADASAPLSVAGVSLGPTPIRLGEAQVARICAAIDKRITQVVDIDAQNDLEDSDYLPSSEEEDDDDDEWSDSEDC